MSRQLDSSAPASPNSNIWLPLCLMLGALALRLLVQFEVVSPTASNLSPLLAFAFVGAVVFPKSFPWWTWLVVLLVIDWVVVGAQLWSRPDHQAAVALTYVCYAAAVWMGHSLRKAAGILNVLLGTLTCSVLFYLVTNSFVWMIRPEYTKDLAGWTQALITGTPGHPPTWLFFRNSLLADMGGAGILLLAYNSEALVRGLRRLPWIKPQDDGALA